MSDKRDRLTAEQVERMRAWLASIHGDSLRDMLSINKLCDMALASLEDGWVSDKSGIEFLLKMDEWVLSLCECGDAGEVGAGMQKIIKEKIHEAYKNGREEGEKERRNRGVSA